MRLAFKEWAVITDALLRGEQIIIFRKGGLREGRGGFQIEYPEFLFLPTLFHQQRDAVLPEGQARYDALAPHFSGAQALRIEGFARVVAWQRLESLEAAERLRGQHIWRDEVIAERFEWGRSKEIHVLAVRAFALPKSVELPMLAAYDGCKSWIELEQDISPEGAQPAMPDADFSVRLQRFQKALEPVAKSPAMP
jgi:hypothetical protein